MTKTITFSDLNHLELRITLHISIFPGKIHPVHPFIHSLSSAVSNSCRTYSSKCEWAMLSKSLVFIYSRHDKVKDSPEKHCEHVLNIPVCRAWGVCSDKRPCGPAIQTFWAFIPLSLTPAAAVWAFNLRSGPEIAVSLSSPLLPH